MRFQRVLCPVDFSDSSRLALDAAIGMAGDEAQLTLLHVIPYPAMYLSSELSLDMSFMTDIMTSAETTIATWRTDAERALGRPVVAICEMGIPWDDIVTRSQHGPYDLIVIGTHGRTGLRRVLLGSVAERVTRHAACSVLVVRAPVKP
jgi:nucleotide-binding universal stress UspA family protein